MVISGKSLQTKWKPQKRHTFFSWRDWRENKPCHGHGGMNYAGPTTLWLRLSNKTSTKKWDHSWPLISIYQLFHHISKAKVYIFRCKVLLKGPKIWPNDHPQGPKQFSMNFLGGYSTTLKCNIDTKTGWFSRWFSFQIWLFEYLKVNVRADDSMKTFHPSQWKKNPSLQLGVKFPAYLEIRLGDDW